MVSYQCMYFKKGIIAYYTSSYKFDSTRVDEGRKKLKSSRDKNEGTYRSGEGGGGPATNVTLDLSYYFTYLLVTVIGIDRQCDITFVRTIAYCAVNHNLLVKEIGLDRQIHTPTTYLKNNCLLQQFLWTYWSKQWVTKARTVVGRGEEGPLRM